MCSRISKDSIEKSLSTFAAEMATTSMILGQSHLSTDGKTRLTSTFQDSRLMYRSCFWTRYLRSFLRGTLLL